ncbi:MAG: hypothetical protein IPL67_10555 [Ignavibacteria bacterium]|nr:hypothetical protein [Ignavibacteria bacterium]
MVIGSKVNKEYKGYIASMGAGIIQSGLLPAVAFTRARLLRVQKTKKSS